MSPRTAHDPRQARIGLLYGLAAYLTWGLSPIYYKLLDHVPPLLVLAHRIVWSVLLLLPLIALRRLWPDLRRALAGRRTLLALLASTVLVSVNWYTFIYAIGSKQILQASLGYYINPLVTVLFGVVFLRERLRRWQVVALAIAAVAVSILTYEQRTFPTIALSLAVSFALYALVRKVAPVGPLVGLFVETVLLIAPAVYVMVEMPLPAVPATARPAWRGDAPQLLVLSFTGFVTAFPLLWFNNAARRLRLATVGLLQYCAPTCNFLVALAYREPFPPGAALAFPLIWGALVLYTWDSWRAATRPAVASGYEVLPPKPPAEPTPVVPADPRA